jgi:aminopeptidase N
MQKKYYLFYLLFIFNSSFSQDAPQKDFIDKLFFSEQQSAAAFLKTSQSRNYNGDNYDLKYHRMNWSIDPDTLFISGEVTSYFTTTKPSVNKIRFDLSSVMIVDSVRYHSLNIFFFHNSGDTLIINLPSTLSLNQLDSVSVFYHGNPPQGSGFGSFTKSLHDSVPIIWTLSEPFGAKDWWPCKNNLSDKIDSIDIFITTPQQYRTASNGMLISEAIQGNFKTAHWKHRYPIATYLIAIAATNYQVFSLYAKNGSDSIQVLNYIFPECIADAQNRMPALIQSMELYENLFTPYPFAKERYGHAQFGRGGGMEHQTMSFVNSFAQELLAHELAHQWTGDMITLGNWHEIWLNEGFATYWQGLTYYYLYPVYWHGWLQTQITKITSQPNGSVYCYDTTDFNRIFDGRLSYSKGAMLLHMLRWVIGDSAFYTGMKSYLSDTNLTYKYACSDNFISHMETASDTTLTEFFNDWLYGEGYPKYSILCNVSSTSNDIQLTINQTQSDPSSVSFFKMPVPVKFKDATHDTIIVFKNTFSGQQYNINLGFRPDSVIFDPDLWIVSANDTTILGTKEYNFSNEISVFPNPVSDFLNINCSGRQFQKAEIYDINGRLVHTIISNISANTNYKINLSDLSRGIYFLKAIIDNDVLIKKITKL